MYLLTEEQIKEIAFKAWQRVDPRSETIAREMFEKWWEWNKGLYLPKNDIIKLN